MAVLNQGCESRNLQDLFTTLLTCCHKVWNLVHDILCYQAPEGRLTYDEDDDDDEDEDDVDNKGKDKLSFCWRALKESRSVYTVSIQIIGIEH